jgi:hypothetical protein
MRIRLIPAFWPLLIAGCLTVLRASGESVAKYRAVQPGQPLAPDSFAVFCPTNIPAREDIPKPEFGAEWCYSGRDWKLCPETRKRRRFPIDSSRLQHVVLAHRVVPAALAVTLERVEATEDSDPVTLAKILRYNREAHAKFRLMSETNQRIAGVDGSLAEYVELRQGTLMRVRHWITHYNGVVCQLQLYVPYDHPELMEMGGPGGFPLLLHFLGATRNRSVLKDADIPRKFVSRYGYRIDLGGGEWIPGVYDPYIPAAENLMCTRNQGGIAVVPLSTLGQEVDRAALLDAMIWLGELPADKFSSKPRPVQEGNLQGLAFEVVLGDEEETIRMRGKALCSAMQGYLALAWINTNSPLSPEVLDHWLAQVSFTDTAAPWPPNTQALTGFRERDRHAMGFWGIGQYYFEHRKFDRSASALRTALDCRFLKPILFSYTESELQRGHPEAIVSYLKSCGPIVLRQGWVAMELAFAESRCGDAGSAAAHYTQCLASGGYSAGAFPPNTFEDYIRCLIQVDRRQWAAQRLKERMASDPSPRWTKMLADLNQPGSVTTGSIAGSAPRKPATASQVAAPSAPTPTGPPELRSIIWSSTQPSAQLDKSLAFEGDHVRGYKVTKISQDSVDLLNPEGASLKLVLSTHGAGK